MTRETERETHTESDGDSALTEFCASSRVINLNRPTAIDRSIDVQTGEGNSAAVCTPSHRDGDDDDGGGGVVDDLGQFMAGSSHGWLPGGGGGGDSEVGGVEAISESNLARRRRRHHHQKTIGSSKALARGTAHLRFQAQTLLLL